MADSIKVAVRLRKLIQREEDQKLECHWTVKDNCVSEKSDGHKYTFDRVYDQDASTDVIYEELIGPILEDAMSGINGTVFAYGQTSSGKTYTMLGTSCSPGIIPICISDIYNTVENTPDREFLIRISYMEIYNENVVDLLGDVKKSLNVYDTADGKVSVRDVTEEVVTSAQQLKLHLKKGEAARHYGSTNMNEKSSRSHTIFRVIIESRERVTNPRDSFDGAVMVAHLNLVDLAGSEKAKQTGATGQRLTEGGFINRSLFTLSQVINQLGNNASFVSYRDSKLTRILQNSLGGNSKTAILCAVTPASLDETHSTLRFATSAKRITNRPVVNEILSDEALMRRMQQEIAELKKQLEKKSQEDNGVGKLLALDSMQTANQELQLKLAEKERLEREQDEKIQRLVDLISVSSRLKPATDEDFRLKKRRRETWCPGKGRPSLAPKAFSKFSTGPTREQCSMVEEENESMAEEDDRPVPFLCNALITDEDFRSFTCSVYAQTDPVEDDSAKASGKGDSFESLQQKVKDQDAEIGELQKSVSSMKEYHDNTIAAKDIEIAELKLSMLMVGTSEGCDSTSRSSEETTVSSKSLSRPRLIDDPQETEIERLKEELASRDKEVEALREALRGSAGSNENLPEKGNSAELELHQGAEQPVPAVGASEEKVKVLLLELEAYKVQLEESLTFCAAQVEKKDLLEKELAASKESKKLADDAYVSLRQELEELVEYTRFEKEFRDASILEKQEESQRELTEQIISLETQLKALKNREEMLKAVVEESASKGSREDELEVKSEMFMSRILDLEQQIEVLKPLKAERDKLIEVNQQLEGKISLLLEQQRTVDTSDEHLEKFSQLEREKDELMKRLTELESQLKELPSHMSAVSHIASDQLVGAETQELEKTRLKKSVQVLEVQLQESELMVTVLKEELKQLTCQLESLSIKENERMDAEQNVALMEKIESLEQRLQHSYVEQTKLKKKLEEQVSLAIDAQNDLVELQDVTFSVRSQLEEREKRILELEEQLSCPVTKSGKERCLSLSSAEHVNSQKPVDFDVVIKRNTESLELLDERQAFVELQRKYEKVTAELKAARDQLLLCSNKDLDVQKCRNNLEQVIKDMNNAVSKSNQENKALVDRLNKEVYELSCQLQKTSCDLQCTQHRLAEAEKEKVQLKAEIQTADGLLLKQESSRKGPGEMDPEKLLDRIKKMNVQIDLTNQRCQNYEAKLKAMEVAAQKFEAVQMERNSLQFQLREAQQQFQQTREEMVRLQQARSNSYTETAQMAFHVANLENKLQSLTRQKEGLQLELETERKEKLEAVGNLEKLTLDERQRVKELSETKQQLVTLTSQMEAIQGELEGKEKERVSRVNESERLLNECQEKETGLLLLKEEISLLTCQKDDLQSQLETLEQDRSSRKADVERLSNQLQAKNDELCSVNQQLATLTCQRDLLQAQLTTEEKEKLAAFAELERISSELCQKEAELSVVKEELTLLTSERVAQEAEQDSLKKDQLAALAKAEELTLERQQLQTEVASFKEQLTMLQKLMKKEAGAELPKKSSEPDKAMECKIDEMRKEESLRWTAVLDKKIEELKKDAEEKRREEILNIQKQAMEKLKEISHNIEAEKQQSIEDLRKQHAKELHEVEQQMSENLHRLEEKYEMDVVNMKAETEKLKLAVKGHEEDAEELRHRFEQDLRDKESELSDMEVILTKKESEIGELEQQLKELGEEVERSRHQHNQSGPNIPFCSTLQQKMDVSEADQTAANAKELEKAHADQVEHLKMQHQEQVARISAEHLSRLNECELRHGEAVKDAMKRSELEMDKRIKGLEEFYVEKLRQMEVSITVLKEDSQKLSYRESEFAQLHSHASELQEMLSTMEQKYQSVCEELARLKAEHDLAVVEKEHTTSELREANSKLVKNVGCLTEQVELLEQELTSGESEYKCNLARFEAQVAEHQHLLAEKDNRVHLFEMEVERLKTCLSSVDAQMQETVEALDKKTAELKLQSEEFASLNKISTEQIEQLAKLKKRIDELQREASGSQNLVVECKNLRAEKSELSKKIQLLQERESQLNVKLTVAAEELSKAKQQFVEEVDGLKLRMMEVEKKKCELESINDELEAVNKKDKAEIADLEKYSSELYEELSTLKEFICDDQLKHREDQLKHREEKIRAADAPRLRKERNELRVKVGCLESQLNGRNLELAVARQEYETIKLRMKEEIERLEKERDGSVVEELKEKKIEVARLKLKVNELETNLIDVTDPLNAKLKSQGLEIMRFESDTKKLKDEVKKLKTALSERPLATPSNAVKPEVPAAGKSDPERMSFGTVSGGGIISDFNYYWTKAENDSMKRNNDNLQAQLSTLKSKFESLKKENADLHYLVVEQQKKLFKCREQFASAPGDVQRTAITTVNSPECPTKTCTDNQGNTVAIDLQKWMVGDSNPYDESLLIKPEDAENCKTQ